MDFISEVSKVFALRCLDEARVYCEPAQSVNCPECQGRPGKCETCDARQAALDALALYIWRLRGSK